MLFRSHSELTAQHERLTEITAKCLELSEKLKGNVHEIKKNIDTIGESTNNTSDRAHVVNDLLTNVIAFCQSNDVMDADSVKQMIVILETTLKAFTTLDENVNTTNESSGLIIQSIIEIRNLVDKINETLNETVNIRN